MTFSATRTQNLYIVGSLNFDQFGDFADFSYHKFEMIFELKEKEIKRIGLDMIYSIPNKKKRT